MARHEQLHRVDVELDHNENGELAWRVSPVMRHHGRLVCVPDTKGWPEHWQAIAEKKRIEAGS